MMLLGHLIFNVGIISLVKAQGKGPIMLPNKLYQGLNNSETYKELNFTTIPTQPPKMKDLGQISWARQAGDEISSSANTFPQIKRANLRAPTMSKATPLY